MEGGEELGVNHKDNLEQQKSIVKSGRAGFNSVMYASENHKVTATWNKYGKIDIEIINVKRSMLNQFNLFLEKIPLIRGAWLLIEGFVIAWKLSIVILLMAILNLFLLNVMLHDKNPERLDNIYTNVISDFHINLILILGILLTCAILNKFTQLGKYHSAEHMVDNAYVASKNLDLSNVQKYSRIHKNCGTNLVVMILLLYLLFIFITNNFILSILISFILGYEVYMIKNPIINNLLKPFYLIGYLVQYHLFTSVPEKKHLEVSIAAYETLLKESRMKYNPTFPE